MFNDNTTPNTDNARIRRSMPKFLEYQITKLTSGKHSMYSFTWTGNNHAFLVTPRAAVNQRKRLRAMGFTQSK